jgi:hypothetical protein
MLHRNYNIHFIYIFVLFIYLVLVNKLFQVLLRNALVQPEQAQDKKQQISSYFMQKLINQMVSL